VSSFALDLIAMTILGGIIQRLDETGVLLLWHFIWTYSIYWLKYMILNGTAFQRLAVSPSSGKTQTREVHSVRCFRQS
jgi:hypothetical protein